MFMCQTFIGMNFFEALKRVLERVHDIVINFKIQFLREILY